MKLLRSTHQSLRWLMYASSPLVLMFLALMPQTGSAQVLYGSLTGRVTDLQGAVVPGATVSLTHRETNQTRQAVTDAGGGYDFATVAAGTYTVKISKSGFKSVTKENVAVTLNTITRADISVEVGQVSETVIVTADAAPIKTDRAEVSAELTSRPLSELPVPLGRNYQQLFKTLPGFTPPEDAHSVPSNPSRSMVFNVNGSSRSSNNTRIDGVTSTNIWLPHVTAYIPALEAIETVNVVTNSFDAEQGLAGGAAINVQIKSGTNDFHGAAFEYHSNQHLKARDYFRPPQNEKGKFIQNQYGGTLGGPIIKDKLFFFVSYEGTKNRQNDSLIDICPDLSDSLRRLQRSRHQYLRSTDRQCRRHRPSDHQLQWRPECHLPRAYRLDRQEDPAAHSGTEPGRRHEQLFCFGRILIRPLDARQ